MSCSFNPGSVVCKIELLSYLFICVYFYVYMFMCVYVCYCMEHMGVCMYLCRLLYTLFFENGVPTETGSLLIKLAWLIVSSNEPPDSASSEQRLRAHATLLTPSFLYGCRGCKHRSSFLHTLLSHVSSPRIAFLF